MRACFGLIAAVFIWLVGGLALAQGPQTTTAPESGPWVGLRTQLFGHRPIQTAAPEMLQLHAPSRAQNPAVVPISIRSKLPHTPGNFVQRLYLVIDENPTPVAAVFHFGPASGGAQIDTRVRIDAYTQVRAIAEMNDGKLYISSQFVKAAGGCSAPAGPGQSTAIGRSRLSPIGSDGKQAVLLIEHPNHTGLVMDPLTRLFAPAHFVRQVEIKQGLARVLLAELSFAISENPSLRFAHQANASERLHAEITDTQDRQWQTVADLSPN